MDKFDNDLDERTAKALGGALASSDPNRFMQDILKFSFQILPLIRPGYLKEVPRQGFAEGGHVLEDDYPTHYLPGVGRQVMADGGTPTQYAPIDASMLVGRSSEPFRGGEEYTDAGGQKIAAPFVKSTSGGYPVYDFMQEPEPSKYSGNLPGDTNPFEPLMQWNWLSKLMGYAHGGEVEGDVQFAPPEVEQAMKTAQEVTADSVPFGEEAKEPPKPKEYEPFSVLPFREDKEGIHFDPHAGLLGSIISGITAPGDVVTGKLDPMSDEGIKRAMDLAGVATSGSTFGTRPAGALASGASRIESTKNPIGMHSPGAEAARALPQEKGTPEQILAMLRKVVPEHEIEHSGIAQEIAGLPSVNREDVAKHFESKLPQIGEKVYSSELNAEQKLRNTPEYIAHQQVFHDNYADDFAQDMYNLNHNQLNDAQRAEVNDRVWDAGHEAAMEGIGDVVPEFAGSPKYSQYTLPEGEAYEEVVLHGSPKKDELVDSKALEEARAAYIRDYINDEVNRALDEGILHQRNAQTVDQDLLNEITAAARVDALMELEQDPEGLASYLTDSGQAPVYRSGHYPEVDDYIAHYRKKMRTSPEGEKIFHLEELQSDRAQQGRKRGFATEDQNLKRDKLNAQIRSLMDQQGRLINDLNANYAEYYRNNPTGPYLGRTLDRAAASGQGDLFNRIENLRDMQVTLENERDNLALSIPPAPYVMDTSHWTDLGLKHAIKKAVEAGADKFVWTPGEEQTKRYSLERTVGKLSWSPDTEELIVHAPNGALMKTMQAPKNKLSDLIGKEAAEKLVSAEPSATKGNVRYNVLEGDDLKIGGEGMRGYYDKIIPSRLKKILKKLDPDVKLETHNLVTKEPNKYNWTGNDFLLREVSVIRNEANEKDLPVQLIRQMDNIRDEMRRGTSFKDAMEKHGSPSIAELFGGELIPKAETKSLPSFKITPKMRENVKKGLSAFRKGGTVEKALDIVRRGDAR